MRILFLGTGPFAVPALKAIHHSRHEVIGLVTRPAPANLRRKQKPPANPMRDAAESLGLPIWEPADINSPAGLEVLRTAAAELLVVCDYGQILSPEALSIAPLGGINLHGSLLPKYRGAAPVHWAIYYGEVVSGISVIHMTPRLDGGPILQQEELAIGPDETMPELEMRLAAVGATAVLDAIEQLQVWDGQTLIGERQDPQQVSKAPRLRKDQGCIDWTLSARQIHNQVRAFQPWPGSYTWLSRTDHAPLRLVIGRSAVLPEPVEGVEPGTLEARNDELVVATGEGWLRLEQLQPAGKRMMDAAEFLRGYPPGHNARLGTES